MNDDALQADANLAELARLRSALAGVRDVLAQRGRALVAAHRAIEIAQADAGALQRLIARYLDDITVSPLELNAGLRDHPGAPLLAVLDAAREAVLTQSTKSYADLMHAVVACDAAQKEVGGDL